MKQDTIMVFRMLFLWMVAAAVARGRGDRDLDFLTEHPEDAKKFVKDLEPASLWATQEICFLEKVLGWSAWEFDQGPLGHVRRKPTRVLSSAPCPRELLGVRGSSTVSAEERDHDGAGFRSVTWAAWAPQLKVVIKDIVETSLAGTTLDRVMKLDASFLEHLRRDHTPYRRDCRACLAGAFRGHMHRRIVAPEAWCLSLDVIGPARQGQDEYIKKVKCGLIGTLVVPDALGKLLQPADLDGDPDDGAGVGPVEAVDPFDQEAEADDEGEAGPSAEAARNMEKWQALVDKEKLDGVSVVEVPFFVSLSSKKSPEVLGAVKEMLLQVRRLGLVVRRIHTDRGKEFVNKGLKGLCRDRDIIYTTTTADDFRANGRVEALVGRAKCAARTYLSSTGMGSDMWPFAMRHYTARLQQAVAEQLGARLPRLPPFGTKVFVRKRSWQMLKEEFVEKVASARILCPSMDVSRGFLVRTEDGHYLTTMVVVENVKEVSGEFEVDAPPAPTSEPGARHRVRGKKPMVAKMEVEDDEHLLQDEELAEAFLEEGNFTWEAAEELLEGSWLSETMVPNRRGEAFGQCPFISAHVVGMFRHGGVVGATNLVRKRPALSRFLVQTMKAHLPPEATFTTLSLNFNTPTQCHRDSNNQSDEKAYLVGLGSYVGGSLWCHEELVKKDVAWVKAHGHWLPGTNLPTHHNLVTFDPRRLHQPQPWEGTRFTITAYTVGCLGNCKGQDRDLLQALGFPLPQSQVQATLEGGGVEGGGKGKGVMKSLLRPKGAIRRFCASFSSCADCDRGPGEDQILKSATGGGRAEDLDGDQGLGEDQTLKSATGGGAAVGLCGERCVRKAWEVDPSLCVCRGLVPQGAGDEPEVSIEGVDVALNARAHLGEVLEDSEGRAEEAWLRERRGAFGPPELAKLQAFDDEVSVSYSLLGSEVPLTVGWDLFDDYLGELRMAVVQEEYADREQLCPEASRVKFVKVLCLDGWPADVTWRTSWRSCLNIASGNLRKQFVPWLRTMKRPPCTPRRSRMKSSDESYLSGFLRCSPSTRAWSGKTRRLSRSTTASFRSGKMLAENSTWSRARRCTPRRRSPGGSTPGP